MPDESPSGQPDIDLGHVVVRPIVSDEKAAFTTLLDRHHYLGSAPLIGHSIQYLACVQDRWLALLVFAAAALKSRPRDQWIGWPPCLHWQRLHLLANNTRFLILPGCSQPNLASKVLSLCAKRIAADWQRCYGYPLLLLETFVDPARFTGTCYRAAGWQELGLTRGFRKSNTRYVQHDRPKRILVRSLHPQARAILAHPMLAPTYQKGAVPQLRLNTKQTDSLFTYVVRLTDPRHLQGQRHTRRALTAIMFCATLCGARGYEAISDWAQHVSQPMRRRLGCTKRGGRYIVPSRSTLYRFINAVDPWEVDQLLGLWLATFGGEDPGIAIDGKTMRGTAKDPRNQTHVLSAVTHDEGRHLTPKKSTPRPLRSPACVPC